MAAGRGFGWGEEVWQGKGEGGGGRGELQGRMLRKQKQATETIAMRQAKRDESPPARHILNV